MHQRRSAYAIMARKEELYELNYQTGATRKDGWIDIEGGAGTLCSLLVQGPPRAARRAMSCSTGRSSPCRRAAASSASISTPRCRARRCTSTPSTSRCGGCSKSSPRPCSPACRRSSSRPASTAYLCEAAFRVMIDTGLLPPGAVQLIVGGVGDLFDHLTGQDVVSFTGSASTALKLRSHPVVAARKRQVRRRAGQPERLAARPRRRARNARVRPVRQGSGQSR